MNLAEIDLDKEENYESKNDEKKCIECGEIGDPIDIELSRPFMCSNCRKSWI